MTRHLRYAWLAAALALLAPVARAETEPQPPAEGPVEGPVEEPAEPIWDEAPTPEPEPGPEPVAEDAPAPVKKAAPRKPAKPVKKTGKLGPEFERMARYGAVTPDAWMEHATGAPVSAGPLLRATAKALK